MKIPVYRPYLEGNEKTYVIQCLDSSWISSRGDFVSKFEARFTEFTGCNHATSVCNGTVAIHLALVALGIGAGDEVIVPTFTYVATVNMILLAGAKPVFVDSSAAGWNLDIEQIEGKITSRTRAVLAVHIYGQACDMEKLQVVCDRHNLLLVEDCAEAFGTLYRGRHVGTFGDAATFSFFGNKTLTTGEGGMVVCRKQETHDKAYHLKTQAVSPSIEYFHDVPGFNYRMTNICAAIGFAQLEKAEEIIARKTVIARRYMEGLSGVEGIEFQKELPETRHSYWMVSLLLRSRKERESVRAFLRHQGIETRPLFHPAHTLPYFQSRELFLVAEDLHERGINLPSWPGLSDDQIAEVCGRIREALG